MILIAMSVSLHLTSVWLCMSVVFVVTLQWPTGTNMTSPFILFLNTYPFSISLKTIYFASNQICKKLFHCQSSYFSYWKIWQLAMKKLETFCFVQSVNHQLSAMCNVEWIVNEVTKIIVTALWYSKVLQGRGGECF